MTSMLNRTSPVPVDLMDSDPARLAPDEVATILAAVASQVAILGPHNEIVWANRAWTAAHDVGPDGAKGLRPRDYIRAERLSEQEGLLEKVRRVGRPIRFSHAPHGSAVETTIYPLENGRLLVLNNPTVATPEAPVPNGMPEPERVTLKRPGYGAVEKLSRRELDVLALLASGLTIKRIAESLGRSEKTIEGHRDSIYRKLGVSSRAELAILAIRAGVMSLVDGPDSDSES